jgi:hypothetical protein
MPQFENIRTCHLPRISIAYTGLLAASESRLRHHNATPEPKPCRRTTGVLVDSGFKQMVQILSAVPTTGPMSTYHPRYPDFKPVTQKSLNCYILYSRKCFSAPTQTSLCFHSTILNITPRWSSTNSSARDYLIRILTFKFYLRKFPCQKIFTRSGTSNRENLHFYNSTT